MKAYQKALVCLILILGLSLPASAQFEDAVWDTITTDTLQDALTRQAIAVNGYEEFHLTYAKQREGGGWNIYYRFYDLLSGMYPERLIEPDMPSNGPVIASRFSDNDYDIAIIFESGGDIWGDIIHDPLGAWNFENLTNYEVESGTSPTIAFGSNQVHAAWINHGGSEYKIAYMRWIGDSASMEIIDDSELGEFGSGASPFIIAIGSVPHIFYRGVNGNSYHIHHAFKPHPDSSWIIEHIMTPNADDYTASADLDLSGDIYLAVSGNDGFGFPGRVYFTRRNHETGQWSNAELVTGQYSATNATITLMYGTIYIAACGVSGNIYDGNVYLSNNASGSFETQLLGSYQSCTQAVVANVIQEYGVLVFDAPIGADEGRNVELVYYGPPSSTSIQDQLIPAVLDFSYCYPNPVNSQVNISFGIKQPATVAIDVYDLLGRRVGSLANEFMMAGRHKVTWDPGDLPSGIYFYRLQAHGKSYHGRMVLLK